MEHHLIDCSKGIFGIRYAADLYPVPPLGLCLNLGKVPKVICIFIPKVNVYTFTYIFT